MIQQFCRLYKTGEAGRWINGNPGAQTLARAAFYAGAEAMRDTMNGEVKDLHELIEDEQEQLRRYERKQGTLTLVPRRDK